MPGVVFRFEGPPQSRCCICGGYVHESKVDMFVFWPGEDDPARAVAHERCLEERTLLAQPPTSSGEAPRPARRAPLRAR